MEENEKSKVGKRSKQGEDEEDGSLSKQCRVY